MIDDSAEPDLDLCDRLEKIATAGPWVYDPEGHDEWKPTIFSTTPRYKGSDPPEPVFCGSMYWSFADGQFCAAARTEWPRAVARVRALESQLVRAMTAAGEWKAEAELVKASTDKERAEWREVGRWLIEKTNDWMDSRREVDEARAALSDAIELAEEGWAYEAVSYFREKWDVDARLKALREQLPVVTIQPQPQQVPVQHDDDGDDDRDA